MADTVVLKERVEIDPDRPVPEYDLPNAKAFAAEARKESQGDLIAYVCDPNVPLRVEAIESMRGITGQGLIRFVEWGIVYWKPRKRRVPVVVYEQPMGGKLFSGDSLTTEPFSEEMLVKGFMAPVVALLRDMSTRGVTHRAIRPNNLYFSDSSRKHLILGDCLTCPPGLHNPVYVESLEEGMADPIARGAGGVGDDVHSLGVIVTLLTLGRLPAAELDPDEIIDRKINLGSYAAITGGARIPSSLVELLRGLLSDDPRERWSLREIELWIGGRRLTPKQAKLPHKAARPMTIGGRDFDNTRSVAQALGRNWLVGGEIVKGQDFDNWLRRSLGDDRVVESVNKVIGGANAIQSVSESDNSKLVSKACMGLDPLAPIRHKGFSAFIDGIGPALAMEFDRDDIRQRVADVINGKFVGPWMALQTRTRPELNELHTVFDRVAVILNQTGPGFGMERLLYELNPEIQCRSPLLESFYITKIEEVIPALERAAQRKERGNEPVDRHLAAFCGARSNDIDERHLRPLGVNDTTGTDRLLGALKLMVRVQTMAKSRPCPNLCAWFADLMKPAVNAYHNLKVRKQVEANVERASSSGTLAELAAIFSDTKASQQDSQGYVRAQQEHQQCNAQVQQLTIEIENKEHLATELGEQVAAVASGVVGSIGSTAVIVMYML